MVEPLISLKKVTKSFGEKVVLNNLNLEIPKGDLIGIVGVSGSGKTTLLNLIVGFWKPNSGNVLFKNEDLRRKRKIINKLVGFATQNGSFYSELSVRENLTYFGKLYNMSMEDIKSRTEQVLKLVELSDSADTTAIELSRGMQRKLDIACALINNPKILILDEPTADLDPVMRKKILAMIKKINSLGATVILTSQLIDETGNVCDKLAILHHNRIIKIGSPEELQNFYSKNTIINLKTSPGNYNKIGKILSKKVNQKLFKNIHLKKDRIIIYTPDSGEVLPKILSTLKKNKEKIVSLNIEKPSVGEIFEALTKQ